MEWRIKNIFDFPEDITWHNGYILIQKINYV